MPEENYSGEAPLDEEHDWRKDGDPSDLLFALDSQYSYDTFEGRAAIYESADSPLPLDIDLFIRNIEIRLEEHIQVSTHVGETFGIMCFGKAPLRVNFSGILADTQKNFGKLYLVDAYKNKLRLGAVARRGKIPVIVFGTHALQGPFIGMQISENSASEDTITVVITMLLTALQITGEGAPLLFDYAHGVESDNPTDFIGNPLGLTEEDINKPSDPQVSVNPSSSEAGQSATAKQAASENPAPQSAPPYSHSQNPDFTGPPKPFYNVG